MVQDTASALFGVEGLQVIEAEAEADGTVTVWAVTDHPRAEACPDLRDGLRRCARVRADPPA